MQYVGVETHRRAAECEVEHRKVSEAHTCTPHSNKAVGHRTRPSEGQHRSDHLGVGTGNKRLSYEVADMGQLTDRNSGMLGADHGRRLQLGGRGEGSSCA